MIIKNLWNNIEIVCGCHEEKVLLQPNENGSTLFYSCPKYYSANRKEGEKACSNRISMNDYQALVEYIGGKLADAELRNEREHLEGFHWKKRNIEYTIEKHDMESNHFIVRVVNRAALR